MSNDSSPFIGVLLRQLAALFASSALILGTAGCGGGNDETESTPPAEASVEEESTEEVAEDSSYESTTDQIVITGQPVDVAQTLSESDQAMKNKDWTRATEALLQVQFSGSISTDQQSWDYNRRMTVLQEQLIEAADSGDPKAQAAIEALRRSRRVR